MRKVFSIIIFLLFFQFVSSTLSGEVGLRKSFKDIDQSLMIQSVPETGSPESQKMDPLLRNLIYKLNQSGEKWGIDGKLIRLGSGPSGTTMIPLFIKSQNIMLTAAQVEANGGEVFSFINDIITTELPVNGVMDIASRSETVFMEVATQAYPKLNVSHVEIGANSVHSGTGLPQAYRGQGVIVGVVDSGIDWQHEDFDGNSGTRIQYLWDMSGTGNPPSGYSYGTEYSKSQIDLGQCQEVDGDDGGGHGTHVSATAAGRPNALSGYTGIAPDADIVFVKGFRSGPGFASTDVVDGCNYIFSKAQAAGKPAVINLSLGGHFGAHDGTSLYEQSLSNLTAAGRVIVAAAGNEGSDQIHLSYTTGGSSINDVRQTIWIIPQGVSTSVADMWYVPGNISVGIAAYDAQFNLLGYTNPVPPGQKIENVSFDIGGGQVLGIVTVDATTISDPNNNHSRVVLVIDSNGGQYNLNAVYWALYTFGSGTFDAWMVSGGYFTTDNDPQNLIFPGDNDKSIGIPATSQKVICVGSYVTKNQWVDMDGITQTQPGNPTIGNISGFSSLGPTRDNRMKPDLSAPGEVIIAALSSNLTIGPNTTPRSNVLQGGKHQKMQGTSMASPHVTGTVALMLQRNHNLDYTQTLNILKSTARKDNFTGPTANNTYGSGKLSALAAVQNTPGGGGPNPITVLEQGFDSQPFPPSNWTNQILNPSYTWMQGNPQNNNFNQIDPTSQFSAICPWVNQNQDEWLISESFALGSGSATLEFYAGYSTAWLSYATLKLHISTNGGGSWTQLWEAENDGQGWIWRQKTIDISAYANNQNLKLGWQYVGNDGDLVGLDGIQVTGFATGLQNQNDSNLPAQYSLSQNYPNPFNPETTIELKLPETSYVTLKIYNILGEQLEILIDKKLPAGTFQYKWNASHLASGVYLYRLDTGNFSETKKLILMK
ncbi:MAG: S8 family peptidase [bacterium]|nr:MAG: S8 family peptidase [bacterium]